MPVHVPTITSLAALGPLGILTRAMGTTTPSQPQVAPQHMLQAHIWWQHFSDRFSITCHLCIPAPPFLVFLFQSHHLTSPHLCAPVRDSGRGQGHKELCSRPEMWVQSSINQTPWSVRTSQACRELAASPKPLPNPTPGAALFPTGMGRARYPAGQHKPLVQPLQALYMDPCVPQQPRSSSLQGRHLPINMHTRCQHHTVREHQQLQQS